MRSLLAVSASDSAAAVASCVQHVSLLRLHPDGKIMQGVNSGTGRCHRANVLLEEFANACLSNPKADLFILL